MIDLVDVAALWSLNDVTVVDTFSTYPTRRAYVLRSKQGMFVAKIDTNAGSQDRMIRSTRVIEYLADRGFPNVPALFRTKSGDAVVSAEAGSIVLLEFVPTQIAGRTPPSVETWRALGAAAALLNSYRDCPVPYAIPIDLALEELAGWARGQPIESGVLDILERLTELQVPSDLGLIHGEINQANAALRADGTVVILDWDAAGRGQTFLDQGYPLITVFLSADDLTFHAAPAAAFYRAYVEAGGALDSSKVFPAALLHALRYVRFADSASRWRRICHALEHEEELSSIFP